MALTVCCVVRMDAGSQPLPMLGHLTEYAAKWPNKSFSFVEKTPVPRSLNHYQILLHKVQRNPYLHHHWTALNCVKSQLRDKVMSDWSRHTSITDASAWIRQEIETRVDPQPELLTRAWIKCYEILNSYPLIDLEKDEPIRVLFLCEAPGAFVSAVNHSIRSRSHGQSPRELQWIATSLNPYHETAARNANAITDDSLIHLTSRNWFFGEDGTGDILSPSFLPSMQRLADSEGKFDLVTADGGISVISDFEYQERKALPLIVSEVLNALSVLKDGGNFILKVFSLLEPQSIGLMYILYQAFEKVSIFKPVSIIEGIKWRMETDGPLTQLLDNYSILQLAQIPMDFVIQFQAAATQFCYWQKEAIQTNVRLYTSMNSVYRKELTSAKKRRARVFLKKFPIEPIPHSDRLSVRYRSLKNIHRP